MAEYLGEDIKAVVRQTNVMIPDYIKADLENQENYRVFAEPVEFKSLPEEEKSLYRLSGEGFNFLLAGTETTAATLTVIMYYLLAQPKTYARLMNDLHDVSPFNLKWTQLEQKPYLWAIIHESLPMISGVSHKSTSYGKKEWVIPRSTPIGMASMINHWNRELFPTLLQKLLLSFGKGSRFCIGEAGPTVCEHLAYCEVYIMAALVAMRVVPKSRLFETTVADITYDHDDFLTRLRSPISIFPSVLTRMGHKNTPKK
ncbi:cytochrome P450 [Colletotrichum falcatum]|nr:cytochrome P450 [Colletotrichum falcatum]